VLRSRNTWLASTAVFSVLAVGLAQYGSSKDIATETDTFSQQYEEVGQDQTFASIEDSANVSRAFHEAPETALTLATTAELKNHNKTPHSQIASVYSGDLSPALIDQNNQSHAADAALLGLNEALKNAGFSSETNSEAAIKNTLSRIADIASTQKAGARVACSLEGSLSIKDNSDGNLSVSADNCNIDGEPITGSVAITNNESNAGSLVAHYQSGDQLSSIGSIECTANSDDCESSVDFSADDKQYRIEEAAIMGDASAGFTVGSRVYSETLGYVDTLAVDMVPCANGGFSSGLIGIADATSETVVTIEYTSCDQYKLTYHGA